MLDVFDRTWCGYVILWRQIFKEAQVHAIFNEWTWLTSETLLFDQVVSVQCWAFQVNILVCWTLSTLIRVSGDFIKVETWFAVVAISCHDGIVVHIVNTVIQWLTSIVWVWFCESIVLHYAYIIKNLWKLRVLAKSHRLTYFCFVLSH